ncbi:MAG: universal stress protein [Candidatus Bathyarchaeota archaeon]|nr:universal stress protein [Candidatus Bathyarchaeum sp.]
MFNKILVAIDGSKTADKAMDFAVDLAQKYSAELIIVSVFDVISKSMAVQEMVFSPAGTTKYFEELESFHEHLLETAINKVNKKVKVTKELLTGRAADKIVETANIENVELIVIGSRGLGGIKEIFLGSVSDRVTNEAKCPVLIVKESSKQ